MLMHKPSKIDIGSVRKKRAEPKKPRNIIKREVLSMELTYALSRMKERITETEIQKPAKQFKKNATRSYRKQIVQIGSFALAGLLLITVLQSLVYLSSAKKASGEILGAATSAYTDLHTAGENITTQNFGAAQQLFVAAQSNIDQAQSKLNNFRALTWLAPQANSADHVLAGAGHLAEAGKKLTTALDLFGDLKVSSKGIETVNFSDKLNANRQLLSQTRDSIRLAANEFNAATGLPMDYAGTLDKARQQVNELGSILDKLIGLEDLYLGFFTQQKTYMLVFENYDEERATGGFIGTYGVLKTDRGAITQLKIESIYQLDGQIYQQIAAPGPFQPAIKRWGTRDANWFADFPTSADKLLYFFELGGETADGVISATPKMFEDILNLTGPIEMPEYGVTLTPDNFQALVQFKTSVDYDKTLNQPKKFLADAAPVFLDHLMNLKKEQWFELLQIFEDNLHQRNILLYSKNADTEKQIQDLGFGGQILSTEYDYLSINNSNLGGTKTDLSIEQSADLKSKILSDGSIINTLTITRKNTAEAPNKDYMRILVPLGSQFVSASGFDNYAYLDSVAAGMRTDPDLAAWDKGQLVSNVYVRTESEKTEFAGWLSTSSGEEKSITITYMLPIKIKADAFGNAQSYSLLIQKQSGSKPYNFHGSIGLGSYKSIWQGPGVASLLNSVNFESNTNTDDYWPIMITK
jgi:hypothetical protein